MDRIDKGDVRLHLDPFILHLIPGQDGGVLIQLDDPRLPGSPLLPTRAVSADEWQAIRKALRPKRRKK